MEMKVRTTASWVPVGTISVALRGFQGKEPRAQRYLRNSSKLSQGLGAMSKGTMDDTGQHDYRFDNASMTESCRVERGPMPPLVLGAGGKHPSWGLCLGFTLC